MTKIETDNWKPLLKISTIIDQVQKERENKQYEIEYKALPDEAITRKNTHDENMFKAYAFLW